MTHNNRIRTFILFVLSIFFLAVNAIAEQATITEFPEDIVARVQEKYDSMSSLSFAFNQRSQGQMSGRPRVGNGTAFFHKDVQKSRMRWNYLDPDQQVLISDGETFSMYFAELDQMIVTPATQLDDDLTYAFFSGNGKIVDNFHILPPEPEYVDELQSDKAVQVVKLVPREPQSQVQSIHLWIAADSLIRRIEMRDHFDTITLLNLKDIKVNFLESASSGDIANLFSFTPPEGTEIIRQ